MKQTTKLHIGINSKVKDKLQKEAEESSMTLNQFCLWILTHYTRKIEIIPD